MTLAGHVRGCVERYNELDFFFCLKVKRQGNTVSKYYNVCEKVTLFHGHSTTFIITI